MDLSNKVALITGAGSGIGRQIALTYSQSGAAVGVADLNIDSATQTAQDILTAGGQAIPLTMDVTDEQQVEQGTQELVNKFGKIDVLVSNAGIQHINPIISLEYANWRKVVAVHLDGAFLTARAAMRQMVDLKTGGCILLMGSVHSKLASPLKAPYVSAKHGLLGLCRSIAKEGAQHNIHSNVICPGFVKTPLVEKQIPRQAKEFNITEEEVVKNIMLKDTVDGEFTTTQDVADTALFLAAFPNKALTGQSVIVSHGWAME